jgi:cell division protein FtsB
MAPSSNRGPGRGPSRSRRPARSRTGPSAAPTPPPEPVLAPARSARFTTRAIILLTVVLLLVASYVTSLNAWWQQRQEIQSTKAQIATTKAQIAELRDDEARWEDPAYVEQQARKRFGWVMPGEVGYRVIGADGEVQGDVAELDDAPDETPDSWQARLWASVEQADAPPAAAEQDSTPTPDPDKVLKKKS